MFAVLFTPPASAEVFEAQDWYEGEARGLGRRFRQAVEATAERISAGPGQFPVVFKTVRRARLRTFPYSLFFVAQEETSFVIACFHASRNPARWQMRT